MNDRMLPAKPEEKKGYVNQLPAIPVSDVTIRSALTVRTMQDVEWIAKMAAQSGFYKDATDMGKAVMKILYGLEMGMGPAESMNSLYCIGGKFAMYSDAIADRMMRGGGELVVDELTALTGTAHLRDRDTGVHSPSVTFTFEMAVKGGYSGNTGWRNDPESQILARLISRLHKRYGRKYFNLAVQGYEETKDTVNDEKLPAQPRPVNLDDNGRRIVKRLTSPEAIEKAKALADFKEPEASESLIETVLDVPDSLEPDDDSKATSDQMKDLLILAEKNGWTGESVTKWIIATFKLDPARLMQELTYNHVKATKEWVTLKKPGEK